jgi:hypothetical protein
MSIAELSVIVTGTVALGTPLINGLIQTQQATRAGKATRLDELRSVLDSGAVALMDFMAIVPRADVTWRPGDPVDFEAMERGLVVMRDGLLQITNAQARIGVRLGVGSDLYEAYLRAHDAAGQYLLYFGSQVRAERIRGRAVRFGGPSLDDLDRLRETRFVKFFDLAAQLTGADRA